MAPEQAGGECVDRRADIWAFGAVLFEMVTGRSPFARASVHEILAAVLRDEPDWSMLDDDIPARIRRLLEWSLEKDARRRLRDLATARLVMDGTLETPAARGQAPSNARRVRQWHLALPWATAVVMGLVAALAVAWNVRPIASPPVVQLTVPVARERLNPATPALSPDGRYLAYTWGPQGARTLSVHLMSEPEGGLLSRSRAPRTPSHRIPRGSGSSPTAS